MRSKDILDKYLDFFTKRGHKQVPNVSLVPENDPTLLYVNSGMFPLVPYLSGEPHPLGKRIMNVQRCLRFFEDLNNVGVTNRHTTAFHMLGNWSLGDYFKEEQLNWFYEFLVEVLGLDIDRIYATVFSGDNNAPKDDTSIDIIKSIFAKYKINARENERIYSYGKSDNWWQRGEAIGELGGPDSEVYYYIGRDGNGVGKNLADFQDEFLEIGNSVFMQYKKTGTGWEELPQKNVDFGGGLERLAMVVQGCDDIYQTDNFFPIIDKLQKMSGQTYLTEDISQKKHMRIIADHMRASVFLAMDGVIPGNKDQGYILRRLLRRVVRSGRSLGLEKDISANLVPVVGNMFFWLYPELETSVKDMQALFGEEEDKFRKTLEKGYKETEKSQEKIRLLIEKKDDSGLAELAFDIFQSYGYPLEMFVEDLKELSPEISEEIIQKVEEKFNKVFGEHQAKSRSGAEQKFKGGLADHSEQVIKYHTATHLLHLGLRKVLGEQVIQHGSNITGERLRFDFNYSQKLTPKQISEVERLVNEQIEKALPVKSAIIAKEEALSTGALHAFNEKYGEQVKVYYIGQDLKKAVSKEFCGGPHVQNTSEIGPLEIYKQDKIGEGLVRVYARIRS